MWRSDAASLADVEAWIARRTNDPEGRFLIVARGDAAIGFVQLTKIDRVDGHAYLGMLIDPAERGHGTGAEALRAMEQQCRKIGLRKILLEVLGENARALRFWTAEGYRVVGTLREHHLHGGVHHDAVILEKLLVPASHYD
jgi:RimJ/RimL family protein N-acetyltransferase